MHSSPCMTVPSSYIFLPLPWLLFLLLTTITVCLSKGRTVSTPQLKCFTHPVNTSIHAKAYKAFPDLPNVSSHTPNPCELIISAHLAFSSHAVFLAHPQTCQGVSPSSHLILLIPSPGLPYPHSVLCSMLSPLWDLQIRASTP